MKKCTIVIALIAATVGVASVVAAAPNDQNNNKRDSSKQSDRIDDVHITVSAGRGRLGFAALQISSELRKHFGAPADRGVLVDQVRSGSPAERAGLHVGDVITEVDSEPCRSASDVIAAISDRKKGDTVDLVVMRGTTRTQLQVTLEDDLDMQRSLRGFHGRTWEDFPELEVPFFGDEEMRRALEDLRKQMEDLRRRMDKRDGGSRT